MKRISVMMLCGVCFYSLHSQAETSPKPTGKHSVGAPLVGKYQIPFMFLNSKRYLGCGRLLVSQTRHDGYSLTVKGSDHYNFTDYSVYPVPMVRFLLGQIDGKRTIEIMNVIIPLFFDKYLKRKHDIDLIETAKTYPEIEME